MDWFKKQAQSEESIKTHWNGRFLEVFIFLPNSSLPTLEQISEASKLVQAYAVGLQKRNVTSTRVKGTATGIKVVCFVQGNFPEYTPKIDPKIQQVRDLPKTYDELKTSNPRSQADGLV